MKVKLPFPPRRASINHLYYVGKHGRIYKSHEAKKWHREAVRIIREAMREWDKTEWEGWIGVRIHLHTPDRRKRDVHNYIKIIADAVSEAIGVDDMYIMIKTYPPRINREDPHVELWMDDGWTDFDAEWYW